MSSRSRFAANAVSRLAEGHDHAGVISPGGGSGAVSIEAVRSLARAARLLERATGELGLAQYRVLSAIAGGDERASRVAERFELGRPTISAAVDALCRGGLLARTDSLDDQRAVDLTLTPQGRAVLRHVEGDMVRTFEDLFLRAKETSEITRTLVALGEALDARQDDERIARHRSLRRTSPRSTST